MARLLACVRLGCIRKVAARSGRPLRAWKHLPEARIPAPLQRRHQRHNRRAGRIRAHLQFSSEMLNAFLHSPQAYATGFAIGHFRLPGRPGSHFRNRLPPAERFRRSIPVARAPSHFPSACARLLGIPALSGITYSFPVSRIALLRGDLSYLGQRDRSHTAFPVVQANL